MMAGWTMGTEAWIWMGAWALVMILVVWLLVREPGHDTSEDPSAIVRARFARGEITEGEFKRAMDALTPDVQISKVTGARPHAAHHRPHGQEARHD